MKEPQRFQGKGSTTAYSSLSLSGHCFQTCVFQQYGRVVRCRFSKRFMRPERMAHTQ